MPKEIVTETVVLKSQAGRDNDRWVHLFTKELGRIQARVKAGMKITSKLSPHLDVFNLSAVRLKNSNSYLVTDALTKERFNNLRRDPNLMGRALEIFSLIDMITPLNLKDLELWYYLVQSMRNSEFDSRELLKILGYNPILATCLLCGGKKVSHFIPSEQAFVCERCSKKINHPMLFDL